MDKTKYPKWCLLAEETIDNEGPIPERADGEITDWANVEEDLRLTDAGKIGGCEYG